VILTTHGLFIAVRRRFEQGLDFGFFTPFSKSHRLKCLIDPTGASHWRRLSTTEQPHSDRYPQLAMDPRLSDFKQHARALPSLLYRTPSATVANNTGPIRAELVCTKNIYGGLVFTGIFASRARAV